MYSDSSEPSGWWLLLSLVFHVLWGVGTYNLADSRGRNAPMAGCVGFFFGLWGYLFYYFFMKDESTGGDWERKSGLGSSSGQGPSTMAPPAQMAAKCWSCGNGYSGNPAQCPTCGSRLSF